MFSPTQRPDGPDVGSVVTNFTYRGERLRRTSTTTPTEQGDQHAVAVYGYDDFGSVTDIRTTTSGPGEDPPAPPDGVESQPVCNEVPDDAEEHVTRYCFDEFERMVLSRGEGVHKPTRYTYDALDRRDSSTVEVDGAARRRDLSYVGTSKLLSREVTTDGDVKTYDYDSQGHRLGQSVRERDAPTGEAPRVRTYATDANGSVEGLENGQGEFGANGDDTYLYDPYGENERVAPEGTISNDPDVALSENARENPFRFEGFYFDSGVKAYDMQAREYRPDSGRFLSADRYESATADQVLQADPLTQNRYAFAGGNPVNNVEFDGHYSGGPNGTGTTWRHRNPPRRGGGPNGNGSTDPTYQPPSAPGPASPSVSPREEIPRDAQHERPRPRVLLEEKYRTIENVVVLDVVQALVGIVSPNLMAVSVEARADRARVHFAFAEERPVDHEDVEDMMGDLTALLGDDGPDWVEAVTHFSATADDWPGRNFRRVFQVKQF